MCGMTMSVSIMCDGLLLEQGQSSSPLSASRQVKPSDSPTVMQRRRMLCSSSTIRQADSVGLHSQCLPDGFFDHGNELLDAERLFHAGRTGSAQRGGGFLVGDIAGNEDHAGGRVRGGAWLSRHGHPRHPRPRACACRRLRRENPRTRAGADLRRRIRWRRRCSRALERRANVCHDCRLIFDQQHRQGRLGDGLKTACRLMVQ